jgi:chemotaxis protein methyltransferase CheR
MNLPNVALSDESFEYLANFIQQSSGITLEKSQSYLVENRLIPIMHQLGIETLEGLVSKLKLQSALVGKLIVEALATHESSFFRDKKVFDYFADTILPKLLSKSPTPSAPKIWSAACSSGQEPYSIGILLKEFANSSAGLANSFNKTIYATDFSEKILEKAKDGIFSHFEAQRGLPIKLLLKYFQKQENNWLINNEIKDLIRFENYNLIKPQKFMIETFDVIFCRNVLIYFNNHDKQQVLEHLASKLKSDGYLLLGACEFVLQSDLLRMKLSVIPEYPGIYKKI